MTEERPPVAPEQLAALKAQMKVPPPPEFLKTLPIEQQAEIAAFIKAIIGRPNPAEMFAKVADGMISAGLQEAKEFEAIVLEALPDMDAKLDRIEKAVSGSGDTFGLLREAKAGNWKRVDAILKAVDGR
jgi:hypothetical protein